MLRSHLVSLVVFSALVSLVFTVLMREDSRGRLRFGLMSFVAFLASAIVAGWLMSPFPS